MAMHAWHALHKGNFLPILGLWVSKDAEFYVRGVIKTKPEIASFNRTSKVREIFTPQHF
jgi:hypothetical protein